MKRRWRDICLEVIYCSEVTKQQPYLSISISRSNKRSGMQTIVIQPLSQDDPIINQTVQVLQWLFTSSERHDLWDRAGTWSDSIFSLVSRRLVYKDKDRFTSTTKTHWTATDLQMQPIATSPPSTSSSIHLKQPRHSFHQTLSNATQQTYQQLWDPDHCYKQGKGTPTRYQKCWARVPAQPDDRCCGVFFCGVSSETERENKKILFLRLNYLTNHFEW